MVPLHDSTLHVWNLYIIVLSLEISFEVELIALVSIRLFFFLEPWALIFFTREYKGQLVTESCSHILLYCPFPMHVKNVPFIYTGFFI